jgi:prepilin-type N-terminal cleavage/methylation domain-containing protein/prepilin-type processing-associated H-X9-DG protein
MAFTLIELLAVVAIIGVIAAFAWPAISRAIQSAREAQGLANLKQVAAAAISYAADNNGTLPYAQKSWNSYFYTELGAYLNQRGDGTTYDPKSLNKVFLDPSAPIRLGQNHFTMTRNLAKSYSDSTKPDVRISSITAPSETVIFFDGAQVFSGNVDITGWAVDNVGLNGISRAQAASWFGPGYLEQAVSKGPNTDTGNTTGNIRWRNQGNTCAKFAFVDGHVALLKPADVKRKFFMLP